VLGVGRLWQSLVFYAPSFSISWCSDWACSLDTEEFWLSIFLRNKTEI
jgi:hypothetical protein